MMNKIVKNFDILAHNLNVLHNHFNGPTKLFLDLYLPKFLDTSVKSFFLCSSIFALFFFAVV